MTKKNSVTDHNNKIVKCLIVVPILKRNSDELMEQAKLEEAEGLAYTLSLEVIDKLIVHLDKYTPATMLKSGKIDEIKSIIAQNEIELVYID